MRQFAYLENEIYKPGALPINSKAILERPG